MVGGGEKVGEGWESRWEGNWAGPQRESNEVDHVHGPQGMKRPHQVRDSENGLQSLLKCRSRPTPD